MIRIFIIDYPIYRCGLATLLKQYTEFEVVGEATKTNDALDEIEELKPDVVIMDVFENNGEGAESIALVRQKCPQVQMLILTSSPKETDFSQAVIAGAKGYLLKSLGLTELINAIRLVAGGSTVVCTPKAATDFCSPAQLNGENKNVLNNLSAREREILQLVALGAKTKEISAKLYISPTTVKAHLRRISEKLESKNRTQSVAKAMQGNILNSP